jgi:pimeloyl-ACP methyl ester carboxylesterase
MVRRAAVVISRPHTRALSFFVLLLALVAAVADGRSSPAQNPPQGQKPVAPAAPPAPKPLVATSPDGAKITFETSGTGPAVMLLHGGGQTRKSWSERGWVERLRKQFTVVAVDLRGTGESGKPATKEAYALDRVLADLVAVADAAGAKRFHLVGFGHGATIGRHLAVRSDRVTSAVLIAANMGPGVTGVVKDAILGMRAKWEPLVDAQAAGKLDVKTLSPSDRVAWEAGVHVSAMALGALVDYPPVEPADIKAPTLWLVGSSDASGMENVKGYESKLAGTRVTLKLLSGLSYTDCFAKSEPVLNEVEPFLVKAS